MDVNLMMIIYKDVTTIKDSTHLGGNLSETLIPQEIQDGR